jgi:uncharacterized protein (TIRG00374 family)
MINKKTLIFLLKACVSISLLAFLLLNIDWQKVLENLGEANIILLIVVALLNIIERFEMTYKWNLLIKVRNISVKFWRLFWINSIGSFLGLFLPSSLGTDVVRGYYLMKNNSEKSVSISSVFVDRILGVFSLLTMGVIAVFLSEDLLSEYNLKTIIVIMFFLCLIAVYIFQRNEVSALLQKIADRIKYKRILEYVLKLHSSIIEYKKYPGVLTVSFMFTLLVQITRVLTYYFISLAFNIEISIVYYFLFVPLIMIVMMVPISVGGFGLREGTFVAFFTLVGMSINEAVVITFVNSILDTINTIIFGGGSYLFYKSPSKDKIIIQNNKLAKSNE